MPWLNLSDLIPENLTPENRDDPIKVIAELLADHQIDPYLIWRGLVGFAPTNDPASLAEKQFDNLFLDNWPLVVELAADEAADNFEWTKNSPATVRVSDVYKTKLPNSRRPSRYLTVSFDPDVGFNPLLDDMRSKRVLRFQLGLPRNSGRSNNPTIDWSAPTDVKAFHFVGVIDDGLPFVHPDINPDGDDVYFVWDQTGFDTKQRDGAQPRNGAAPELMAYGQEFVGLPKIVADQTGRIVTHRSPIKGAIEFARGLVPSRYDQIAYEILGYEIMDGAQRRHGVGVMHAASGRGARLPRIAGGSPLHKHSSERFPTIAVQFPRSAAADTSGGWLGFHTLDGVRYIINRAETVAKRAGVGSKWDVVINISFGGSAGPHDGTSMLDGAIDEICKAYGDNVAIVYGAGNTYGRRMHAFREVTSDKPGRFTVNVPPDKASDSYVEFWLPPSLQSSPEQVHFEVTSPDGDRYCLHAAELAVWRAKRGIGKPDDTTAAAIFSKQVAQSTKSTMMLLAIRPTAASRLRQRALAGRWEVVVKLNQTVNGKHEVHAWVERDDRLVGVRRSQQATFVDDGSGSVCYVSDSNRTPAPLDRYTLNSISYGPMTFAVGSLTARSRMQNSPSGLFAEVSRYSSSGPGLGSSRKRPDMSAVADASFATPGLIFSGTFAGQTTRMSGTSIAAPRVARGFAEVLASGGKISNARKSLERAPAAATPQSAERVGPFWLP